MKYAHGLIIEELAQKLKAKRVNIETTAKWLQWIKTDRIARYFESAHAAIMARIRGKSGPYARL